MVELFHELSGCRFESHCSHLNNPFIYNYCVPWLTSRSRKLTILFQEKMQNSWLNSWKINLHILETLQHSLLEVFLMCSSKFRKIHIKTPVPVFSFSKVSAWRYSIISPWFQAVRPVTILKKTLWHRCFPLNFAKFLRRPLS